MPTLLILAAGMGSRYGGLKQIDPVGPHQEILLDYSIYDAVQAGFTQVIFVIRKEIDGHFQKFTGRRYEKQIHCEYVYQELNSLPSRFEISIGREKPWGTAHAVLVCEPVVNEPFAVINADDFYDKTAYRILFQFLNRETTENHIAHYAMVGFALKNTLSPYGAVSRAICDINKDHHLLSITEQTKIIKTDNGIGYRDEKNAWHSLTGDEIISMNFWGFTPSIFSYLKESFDAFIKANMDNPNTEFFLPTIIDHLIKQKHAIVSVALSPDQWAGMTYPQDKTLVSDYLKMLTDTGYYPEKLW